MRLWTLWLACLSGLSLGQGDADLRALLRRAGQPDSLSLPRAVEALLASEDVRAGQWEQELAALFPRLPAALKLDIAFVCGEGGERLELCSALVGEASVCFEGQEFARSSLLQAAYSLARQHAGDPDWLEQLPFAFDCSAAQQALLGEVLAASGEAPGRAFLKLAIQREERELVALTLPRLALPSLGPELIEPLAALVDDGAYPEATRDAAVERLGALGRPAMPALLACFARASGEPASPARDLRVQLLHQTLVAVNGRDLGATPQRWLTKDVAGPTTLGPVQPKASTPLPSWLGSLVVCALLGVLTAIMLLLRSGGVAPFITGSLAGVALLLVWRDALAVGSEVWSSGWASLGIVALSLGVAVEMLILARRQPWLRPRPTPAPSGPRVDSLLGEAFDAVQHTLREAPASAPAAPAPGPAAVAAQAAALAAQAAAGATVEVMKAAARAESPDTPHDLAKDAARKPAADAGSPAARPEEGSLPAS